MLSGQGIRHSGLVLVRAGKTCGCPWSQGLKRSQRSIRTLRDESTARNSDDSRRFGRRFRAHSRGVFDRRCVHARSCHAELEELRIDLGISAGVFLASARDSGKLQSQWRRKISGQKGLQPTALSCRVDGASAEIIRLSWRSVRTIDRTDPVGTSAS